jgi:hypothetical protein
MQMLGRMIDDFKASVSNAVGLTSLAAAAALTMLVTVVFLCAAGFVYMRENYGTINACLAGAGAFFAVTLIVMIAYAVRKNRIRKRPVRAAKSAMHTAFADPMVVAAGLQVVRAIGIKKLIPILAVGGIALGFLASSRSAAQNSETPAE